MDFEKTVNADILKSLNESAEMDTTLKCKNESGDNELKKEYRERVKRIFDDHTSHFWIPVGDKFLTGEYDSETKDDGSLDEYVFSYLVDKVDDDGYSNGNVIRDAYIEIGANDDIIDGYFDHLIGGLNESASNGKKRVCKRCHHEVFPSDVKGYPYVCKHCDENLYGFETEEVDDDGMGEATGQFAGLIKALEEVEESFGVVLDTEIDNSGDNEFWFDTNYNRKTFETETEANEFEDKYQETFSKWCNDNGYRCNRSEDEDAPLSFWITKIIDENTAGQSKECDCGSKDCPICGKKIEESDESRQYQGYTYAIEKCDGKDAYCLTVTDDDGEKVNWDEKKFGTAEGQTFDELAERAHAIIDADILSLARHEFREYGNSSKILRVIEQQLGKMFDGKVETNTVDPTDETLEFHVLDWQNLPAEPDIEDVLEDMFGGDASIHVEWHRYNDKGEKDDDGETISVFVTMKGPENINESADSNKVLYFGFSVKEPVEGLEDKIESGFYQFDFADKHYIVAEALVDGEFRITSEAFILGEIFDAVGDQGDFVGKEGIHAFIGTNKSLEKEIIGKAIPIASYDEDGNVIECLNVDVFDLIGMTDTVASEIFAGDEEKEIAGYRIADEKEITECECGSEDCPICGKKKINEGKECKKVCFTTSDPTLIDALNSGVVGLTLTVKTVEEDGKEGTAEIAIKPDAIKELAINDCEEEKPVEECECGSKDCPICGKKTEENKQ